MLMWWSVCGCRAHAGHSAVAVEGSFYVIGGTVNGIPDASVFEFQINITTWLTYQIGGGTRAATATAAVQRNPSKARLTQPASILSVPVAVSLSTAFGTPGLALHASAFVPSTRQIFIVGGETDALDWVGLVWRFHVDTKQATIFPTSACDWPSVGQRPRC